MGENMQSLASKVALVTGASSGIGACTAVHFASLKCKLSLTGRNEENLRKVVEDCKKAGANAEDVKISADNTVFNINDIQNDPIHREKNWKCSQISTVIGDVSQLEDIKRILESTIQTFGRLDILVNNAGVLIPGTVENTSLENFDLTMSTNIRAMFLMTQLAIPHLRKTKGRIVNVSSIAGLRSFPGIAAYCMSKAAVDQFTKCTALEVASDGIRVNSVNPGVVVTEVHKRGGMSEEEYAKFLEKGKETHPLGRVGTVDEVARAIAFLASDSASFITGVNLPVDGGRGAMCPR